MSQTEKEQRPATPELSEEDLVMLELTAALSDLSTHDMPAEAKTRSHVTSSGMLHLRDENVDPKKFNFRSISQYTPSHFAQPPAKPQKHKAADELDTRTIFSRSRS